MNMAGFKNHEGLLVLHCIYRKRTVLSDDENVQFKTAFLEIAKSRKATFCLYHLDQNLIVT